LAKWPEAVNAFVDAALHGATPAGGSFSFSGGVRSNTVAGALGAHFSVDVDLEQQQEQDRGHG
jgi:hypothetical protein